MAIACVLLNAEGKEAADLTFEPKNLAELLKLVAAGTINKTTAKAVFELIYADNIDPVAYVKENGLEMVSDDGALDAMIDEVIAANPKSVADYQGGKKAAFGLPGGPDYESQQRQGGRWQGER